MIIQRLQFAPSIILDEIIVISLEAVEASPQSNVRFCLLRYVSSGRRADIQTVDDAIVTHRNKGQFEATRWLQLSRYLLSPGVPDAEER